MTRIDFYILKASSAGEREMFACRLTEKAFEQGHRIYIHVADETAVARLDELLWTFRADSFLPHERLDIPDADIDTPIHIGSGEEPGPHDDVLINLADDVPLFFSRFRRVAEVIAGDEAHRATGRERYRFYRDRGYPLEAHKL
ncbi:DNA polymerase III subunit chi [Thiohalomonas denitrificans]|uniref:DNA polymerase III subunit chi n=1 Tax=Thiohalomonas denitrificans TaxID=415747 RepID=UPI0026EDB481|nr:DNA polymerase III subunit chi [Thiohalomonas denitrificans]